MLEKMRELLAEEPFDESKSYLLSQELEFEFAKSMLTFSFAFIGGVVTLKTAIAAEQAIEPSFVGALMMGGIAAFFAFIAQAGIVDDLRKKRSASPLKRLLRTVPTIFTLGMGVGMAFKYFGLLA